MEYPEIDKYVNFISTYKEDDDEDESELYLFFADGVRSLYDDDEKKYRYCLKKFNSCAASGNEYVQYTLGILYYYAMDDFKFQDAAEAYKWFKLSAEQGYAYAQHKLAHAYKNGTGVKKNFKEYVKWLKLSAEQDNDEARYELGTLYKIGTPGKYGVEKNLIEAYKLFKLSSFSMPKANDEMDKLNNDIIFEIIREQEECKKQIEKLKETIKEKDQFIEHLKLYPGSDFKQAEKDFYLLSKK